jgi:type VI secretion system protein ImpC
MADTSRETATSAAPVAETSLLDSILSETKLGPADGDAFALVKSGTRKLLDELIRSDQATPKIDKNLIESMIADIDRRLSAQVNEIMQDKAVKSLESAWRGLKYLIDQVDFRENIRVELLNASKEDLRNDFEDAPDITKSGLYNTVYRSAYGTLGGKPYGCICSTYDFGPGTEDISLLSKCAAVGAMAHAPFFGNTSPKMFGVDSFTEIPKLRDLQALFEGPQYAKWNNFRETEDARYIALCMPRFMLRAPYGKRESELSVKAFDFSEDVIDQHDRYVWGSASIAMAARVADSFAKYRWCPNIIGPQAAARSTTCRSTSTSRAARSRPRSRARSRSTTAASTSSPSRASSAWCSARTATTPRSSRPTRSRSPRCSPRPPRARPPRPTTCSGPASRTCSSSPASPTTSRSCSASRSARGRAAPTSTASSTTGSASTSPTCRTRRPRPARASRSRRPRSSSRRSRAQVGWYRCGLAIEPHIKFEGAEFTLSLVGKLDKS